MGEQDDECEQDHESAYDLVRKTPIEDWNKKTMKAQLKLSGMEKWNDHITVPLRVLQNGIKKHNGKNLDCVEEAASTFKETYNKEVYDADDPFKSGDKMTIGAARTIIRNLRDLYLETHDKVEFSKGEERITIPTAKFKQPAPRQVPREAA